MLRRRRSQQKCEYLEERSERILKNKRRRKATKQELRRKIKEILITESNF